MPPLAKPTIKFGTIVAHIILKPEKHRSMTTRKCIVYSVWVGGGEVNDYYENELKDARAIAKSWRENGYDDVAIEQIELDPVTGDFVQSWWVK